MEILRPFWNLSLERNPISLWGRTHLDCGVQLFRVCVLRQCNCRLEPKVRVTVKMQQIASDRDGDFPLRVIPHHSSFPPALERVKLCISGSISRAFGFGGNLIVCVGNESADHASKGDDLSKWSHGLRSQALAKDPLSGIQAGIENFPFTGSPTDRKSLRRFVPAVYFS